MTEESYEIMAMDEEYKHNLMRAEAQVNEVALEMQTRETETVYEEARTACLEAIEEQVEEQENSIQCARQQYHTFMKGQSIE